MTYAYVGNRWANGAAHRAIAARVLGRPLKDGESVHHWNENKKDNRHANLLICTESYHQMIHRRMRALAATGDANALRCSFCKTWERDHSLLSIRQVGKTQHSKHWLCVNEYDRARYRRKMARVGYVRGPYKVR